jgi:hypothetical protein
MFGFGRAKDARARSFDVAGMEKSFNDLMTTAHKMSEEQQLGVAAGVTVAMRTFGKLYRGDFKKFVNQRASVQEHFINILDASAKDARNNPAAVNIHGRNLGREMAVGIRLASMYFTAMLPLSHSEWRTDAVYTMVDRLSAQLTPLNEKGQALLGPT